MGTLTNSQFLPERTIPVGESLPLKVLLNTDSIKTLLNEICPDRHKKVFRVEINFLRYYPRVSCIVCYKAEFEDFQKGFTDESIIYLGSYTSDHFSRLVGQLEKRKWTPGSILPGPQLVPKLNAILYQFPNDAAMPGLQLLGDCEKLKELLNEAIDKKPNPLDGDKVHSAACQHLRYKPENRLITRCEFHRANGALEPDKRKSVILRIEKNNESKASFSRIRKLYEAFQYDSQISLPKPLACFPEHNLQLFEWVEGEKLSELLRGNEPETWVKKAAESLSLVHDCRIPDLPRRQPDFEKRRISHIAKFLSFTFEDVKTSSRQIALQLDSLSTARPEIMTGLVHGDFHQGQVLIADRRHYVLDFSGARWGDQSADLGNFACQLTYWGLLNRLKNASELEKHFVNVYQLARGKSVPPAGLKFWKTIGLMELAMREFRRLKPAWPMTCRMLLEECQRTLNS